jgi:hypothetical protein
MGFHTLTPLPRLADTKRIGEADSQFFVSAPHEATLARFIEQASFATQSAKS